MISEPLMMTLFSSPVTIFAQSANSTGRKMAPMINNTYIALGLFSSFSSEVVLGSFA